MDMAMDSLEEFTIEATDSTQVIPVHVNSTTLIAKWLLIERVYEKLHRPNSYYAGSTFDHGCKDVSIQLMTEKHFDYHLLHIFAQGRCNEYAFAISSHSEITYSTDKNLTNKAYILQPFQYHNLKNESRIDQYIKTFHFTDLDVEPLKGKCLYISIGISKLNQILDPNSLYEVTSRHNFRNLINSKRDSDFVIESMDGDKLHVHKVLMTAHSSVFAAMLKDDTAESQRNYVKLQDMSGDEIKQLLYFIYTGSLPVGEEVNYINLLILADRYDMQGLQKLCEHRLVQDLTQDNALDYLVTGDIVSSSMLKFAAMKFIRKNPEVIKSMSFNDVTNMDILKELFVYCAK